MDGSYLQLLNLQAKVLNNNLSTFTQGLDLTTIVSACNIVLDWKIL